MALKRALRSAVTVRIDELVLDGFARRDRDGIATALERELGRLFASSDPKTMRAGRDAARIDGGSFAAPASMSADRVGVQVARAVHRGVGRTGGRGA